MIRVVALDLGGVLSWPPDLYTSTAALLGVDPDAYETAYWADRHAFDLGMPIDEYYGRLLAALDVQPDPAVLARLPQHDIRMWCELRPSARALIDTVAGWEQRLVIVSNAPATLREAVELADWFPQVERVFISAELGLAKPDRALYAEVTAALGVEPDEIAFIDDRTPNVTAATDFGWTAHEWIDDADSLAWLQQVTGR